MPPGALGALVDHMRVAAYLPRLRMHYRQHGHEFGATSAAEYERQFLEHVARNDLHRFTFIRPETGDVRWHLLEPATGAVAVYNETRMRYWSFFQNEYIAMYLSGVRGYWIEVFQDEHDWRFRPW